MNYQDDSGRDDDDELKILYTNNHDWTDIPKKPQQVNLSDGDFAWWVENNRQDIDNLWTDVINVIKECGQKPIIDEYSAYAIWCVTLYNIRDLKSKNSVITYGGRKGRIPK